MLHTTKLFIETLGFNRIDVQLAYLVGVSYSELVYTSDTSTFVSFDQLSIVLFTGSIAMDDFDSISPIVQTAVQQISAGQNHCWRCHCSHCHHCCHLHHQCYNSHCYQHRHTATTTITTTTATATTITIVEPPLPSMHSAHHHQKQQ